jgi:hypothetical protein
LKGKLTSGTHEGVTAEAFVASRSVFTVAEGTTLFHQHVALLNKAILAKSNQNLEFVYLLAPLQGRLFKLRHAYMNDTQYIVAMKQRKGTLSSASEAN